MDTWPRDNRILGRLGAAIMTAAVAGAGASAGCAAAARPDARVPIGFHAGATVVGAVSPLDKDPRCDFRCDSSEGTEVRAVAEVHAQYAWSHGDGDSATALALHVPAFAAFPEYTVFATMGGGRLDVFHTRRTSAHRHVGVGAELGLTPSVYGVATQELSPGSAVSVTARAITGMFAIPIPGAQLQVALNRGPVSVFASYGYFAGDSGRIEIGLKDVDVYQVDHLFVTGVMLGTL